MKKAGTEKKKVRRSAAGSMQSGGSDTPPRVPPLSLPLFLNIVIDFWHFFV